MKYIFEALSTCLSGILVFLITRQWKDMREYRKKREAEELAKEAQKVDEWMAMRTAIQYLILTQFAYEKQRVIDEMQSVSPGVAIDEDGYFTQE